MHESSTALIVATWGASLVLASAILLAAWLARASRKPKVRQTSSSATDPPSLRGARSHELTVALDDAIALNGYNVHAENDPIVRLGTAVKFVPLNYHGSAHEIMQSFREGRVVSVDLGKMDKHEAARLVDFCSGLAAVDSGWIFQVTARVIVLTPLT